MNNKQRFIQFKYFFLYDLIIAVFFMCNFYYFLILQHLLDFYYYINNINFIGPFIKFF